MMKAAVSYRDGVAARATPAPQRPTWLAQALSRAADADWLLLWLLLAALAWTPWYFGGNDLFAWGVNALLFPGVAALYEALILCLGRRHAVSVGDLKLPGVLFAAVVMWILIQNATWTPAFMQHPIWDMAGGNLGPEVQGSISVNRDLTSLALLRLMTAASVFWVALQLCRDAARANFFIGALVAIITAYAAYGLFAFGAFPPSGPGRNFVVSTFVNRNHFVTYAGLGLVAVFGLILRRYRREVATGGGSLQFRIMTIIDATGQRGAILLGAAAVLLVAALLTGSRGGLLAIGLGLITTAALASPRHRQGLVEHRVLIGLFAVVAVALVLAFGDILASMIAEKGAVDASRAAVYVIALRSIADAPLLGYGYGTFADVFPMFRDNSLSTIGVWEQAHNTYLEVLQGLGIPFGVMLLGSVVLLAARCARGATTRREGVTVPAIAAGAAVLVGAHALVDFSLQIQAVTLTFAGILGAGVAQSTSSRIATHD